MAPGAAADLVVVLHAAFLVFVGVGALAVRRMPAVGWLHVPAVAWGVLAVTVGSDCPLTAVEKWLRAAAGQEPYAGGFVDQYVEGVLYPERVTPVLWALVAGTVVVGYARLALDQWASRRPGPTRRRRTGVTVTSDAHTAARTSGSAPPRWVGPGAAVTGTSSVRRS